MIQGSAEMYSRLIDFGEGRLQNGAEGLHVDCPAFFDFRAGEALFRQLVGDGFLFHGISSFWGSIAEKEGFVQ